jgi:hypothetical protein
MLLSSDEFDENTRVGTSSIKKVKERIRLATEAFANTRMVSAS